MLLSLEQKEYSQLGVGLGVGSRWVCVTSRDDRVGAMTPVTSRVDKQQTPPCNVGFVQKLFFFFFLILILASFIKGMALTRMHFTWKTLKSALRGVGTAWLSAKLTHGELFSRFPLESGVHPHHAHTFILRIRGTPGQQNLLQMLINSPNPPVKWGGGSFISLFQRGDGKPRSEMTN